jgi:hypothetical protein
MTQRTQFDPANWNCSLHTAQTSASEHEAQFPTSQERQVLLEVREKREEQSVQTSLVIAHLEQFATAHERGEQTLSLSPKVASHFEQTS